MVWLPLFAICVKLIISTKCYSCCFTFVIDDLGLTEQNLEPKVSFLKSGDGHSPACFKGRWCGFKGAATGSFIDSNTGWMKVVSYLSGMGWKGNSHIDRYTQTEANAWFQIKEDWEHPMNWTGFRNVRQKHSELNGVHFDAACCNWWTSKRWEGTKKRVPQLKDSRPLSNNGLGLRFTRPQNEGNLL